MKYLRFVSSGFLIWLIFLLATLYVVNIVLNATNNLFSLNQEIYFVKIIVFTLIALIFLMLYKANFQNRNSMIEAVSTSSDNPIYRYLHVFFCILWLPYLAVGLFAGGTYSAEHHFNLYCLALIAIVAYLPMAVFAIFLSYKLEKINQVKKARYILLVPFLNIIFSIFVLLYL